MRLKCIKGNCRFKGREVCGGVRQSGEITHCHQLINSMSLTTPLIDNENRILIDWDKTDDTEANRLLRRLGRVIHRLTALHSKKRLLSKKPNKMNKGKLRILT